MPPKKADVKSDRGQKKAEEKIKQKSLDDKTFGLKNKNKSKTVQKYIKQVQQTGKPQQKGGESAEVNKALQAKELKKKQEKEDALMASLFKGKDNLVAIRVDEKHAIPFDPKQSRADQKIDLYADRGESAGWTQAELEEVIEQKHGESNSEANETAIVCKFFLDAVEKRQYGWFWTCPNGGEKCRYKHCLPPGYVLKRELVKNDDDEDETPLEELIEAERAALPSGGTPVTMESFAAWKEKKAKEAVAAKEAERKEAAKKGTKQVTLVSGKDLFDINPDLFVDDADAAGEDEYGDLLESEEEDDKDGDEEDDEGGDDDDDDEPSENDGDNDDPGVVSNVNVFLDQDDEPEDFDEALLDD